MNKIALDLGDNASEGEEAILNVNNAYAQRYDDWRRREEIEKLKTRVGDDEDSSSGSSEDVAEWTLNDERNFLHTLSALKTKDPKIYQKENVFNLDPDKVDSVPQSRKKRGSGEKPLYLKDYERKLIIEKGGMIDDDEDGNQPQSRVTPNYFKKQEELKNQLKSALEDSCTSDVLLKKKEKTESQIKKEDDEYYAWLKGQDNEDNSKFEGLKGLKEIWHNDGNLDNEERFLRDFLLEKKYEVDNERSIVGCEDLGMITDDEEEMEREQQFEQKYNFRFEEPDKEFIKQYPRNIPESLRKNDDRRKEKRLVRKQRKTAEKQAKKEEIRELKALKKKEIEAKLEKLKKLAGEEIDINPEDVECDFDPAVYDKRMAELFNSEYYDKADEDEQKPCFSEDSDISDDDNSNDLNLEAENSESSNKEPTDIAEGSNALYREKPPTARRKKRNARFWDAVAKKKPLFNPEEKTFEEYFNEYYALDYEDIIGNTITRFKYRNVPANSFGLTNEEILSADDRQLNAWVSVKKVTAYRTDAEEKYDIVAYAKKALDIGKKKRILSADYSGAKEGKKTCANGHKGPTKSKGSKGVKNNSDRGSVLEDEAPSKKDPDGSLNKGATREGQKKVRRRKKTSKCKSKHSNNVIDIDDSRLMAYGVNPKKFRNKMKYMDKAGQSRASVK